MKNKIIDYFLSVVCMTCIFYSLSHGFGYLLNSPLDLMFRVYFAVFFLFMGSVLIPGRIYIYIELRKRLFDTDIYRKRYDKSSTVADMWGDDLGGIYKPLEELHRFIGNTTSFCFLTAVILSISHFYINNFTTALTLAFLLRGSYLLSKLSRRVNQNFDVMFDAMKNKATVEMKRRLKKELQIIYSSGDPKKIVELEELLKNAKGFTIC